MFLSGDLSCILIRSARLTVRAFTAGDTAESFKEASATIARYMSWNPPASQDEFETIWQRRLWDMQDGTQLHLLIRLNGTDEFIGATGVYPADGTVLEIGVWIKEAAQGRGYGREAVAAAINWAGETFRPSGFPYPVVDENTPSIKLAESLGGKIIGTRKRRKPGDTERTVLLYNILAPYLRPSSSRPAIQGSAP